jgi:hypothetical protein
MVLLLLCLLLLACACWRGVVGMSTAWLLAKPMRHWLLLLVSGRSGLSILHKQQHVQAPVLLQWLWLYMHC